MVRVCRQMAHRVQSTMHKKTRTCRPESSTKQVEDSSAQSTTRKSAVGEFNCEVSLSRIPTGRSPENPDKAQAADTRQHTHMHLIGLVSTMLPACAMQFLHTAERSVCAQIAAVKEVTQNGCKEHIRVHSDALRSKSAEHHMSR